MKRKLALALMLVLMLLMLVPFEALAQSTVDNDTGAATAILATNQRMSFYANGRYWAFYVESTNLCFRTSTDSISWSVATTLRGSVSSSEGKAFDIYFDGVYGHYAVAISGKIYYCKFTPEAAGTIVLNYAEQTAVASGASIPSVCVDSNGYPFISYYTTNYPYVTKSSTNDGSWSTQVDFPYQLEGGTYLWTRVIPLLGGKIVALYQKSSGSTPLKAKIWSGSAWGSEKATASNALPSASSSSFSAVGQDDIVHIVFLKQTSYDIIYTIFDTSTGVFSAEAILYSAASSTSAPAMTMDSANNLHVFWENDPTDDHMYYAKYLYGNSTWVSYYDLIDEIDDLPAIGYYLNTDYTCDESRVGIYYIAGTTILKFKLLDEPFVVDTLSASPVGLTFATLRGEIMSLGFGSATERGFLLNTSPTTVGAWLEGNETGTFNVGVFTHGVTGLTMFQTYWYIAYASGDYGTSYGNWTSFDTSPPVPTPPSGNITGDTAAICGTTVYNFLAIPVTNTDIKLLWDWWPAAGNSSVQIAIRYKLYSYPGNTTDGTQIYLGTGDAYTHTNLSPGTTYYYRAWLLCGGNYSADYVQDWATTYGSSPVVSPPEQPEGWFQDPSCTAYSKIPLLSDALVAVTTAYGFPATTVCVMFTLLWIIVLGLAVFLFIHSAMMMIITIAVLIILASIMGLLPLWMIVIAICLGGISIYISGRT